MQPQDLLIALLLILEKRPLYQKDIAKRLGISRAGVSYAMKRLSELNLVSEDQTKVMTQTILDFIRYAIAIVYPVVQGPQVRGAYTAVSAAPLSSMIHSDQAFVWKSDGGNVIGQQISPIYPTVPDIIDSEPALYEVLALIDAIRMGTSREKNVAYDLLVEKLTAA